MSATDVTKRKTRTSTTHSIVTVIVTKAVTVVDETERDTVTATESERITVHNHSLSRLIMLTISDLPGV
jgi:hypothetical protein